MNGIFPIWTPYLIKLTACTADVISPFVEAILTIYRIHCNNERLQCLQTPNTPVASGSHTILCDSPDSGIVLANDTKSTKSDTDNEDEAEDDDNNINEDDDSEEEDEPYHCFEYPIMPKRRRIF